MSEAPQDDPTDVGLEELPRERVGDEFYREIDKEIAKFQWKIIEETDPESGLKRYVLINEYGHPLWWINHADKRVAALAVQAFVAGALQARDEEREHKKELFDKLERWYPPPSGEFN